MSKEKKVKKEKKSKGKKAKSKKVKKPSTELKPSKAELAILKSFGKQFTIDLDPNPDPNADVPYVIPFNHKGLQYITGGIPGGLFIEVHGPSQCGKSYIMYDAGKAFIQAGGWFYQCDAERAYKRVIGKRLGLEGNFRFAKSKSRGIETVFAEMKTFVLKIRKHDKDCPILTAIDSYNFLSLNESLKDLEKEYKETEGVKKISPKKLAGFIHMRKNNAFGVELKDYLDFIEKQKVTFLLLSQEKTDYSIMFGDKKKVNAEKIIDYDCSLRLRGHLGAKIKHKKLDKIIGRHVTWECRKSRHPDIPPFMRAKTEIIYRDGVRPYSGLDELLASEGRAEKCKKGNRKAVKFPNGDVIILDKLPAYLEENPKLLELDI